MKHCAIIVCFVFLIAAAHAAAAYKSMTIDMMTDGKPRVDETFMSNKTFLGLLPL